MRTWLIKHALNNVWAKPNIDAQTVCALVRLSSPSLDRVLVNLEGENVWLPTDSDNYGVYDLGSFHPRRGILNIDFWEGWVTLENLVNRTGASFVFYNIDGVLLPSKYVYIKRTQSDRFIVAIKEDSRFVSLKHDAIYCKLYDHYALKNEPQESYKGVRIVTSEVADAYVSHNLITAYHQRLIENPYAQAWVNGILVTEPTVSDVPPGSYFEVIDDDTVFELHTFRVGDLAAFHSELDKVKKYLLHIPKGGEFAYHDDVELYIVSGNRGRYYHRHTRAALTQLTHGDFAVGTKNIEDYAVAFENWNDVEILLYIRRPGMNTPMIFNHNRIHELYRLSDEKIVNVLTGINSHLPFWKASELERSAVNYLRSSPIEAISHKMVSDTYGYNAALYYSADTPSRAIVDSTGYKSTKLPPLLNHSSTCYEYDGEGRLLGWWGHVAGEYICKRNSTTLVEAIPGPAGETLDVVYGADDVLIDRYSNYRFFLQRIENDGTPIEEYIDVTGTEAYFVDDNFIVRWTYDETRYRTVILSDKNHLVVKKTVEESEGLIRVGVTHKLPDGRDLPVPFTFATVEIWLNGHPIVYGIDYLVDWPAVTVINKTFLHQGTTQEVVVRARVPAAEINPPKTGFIIGGLLSENSTYDIKDDKIVRIVYGGGIRHRDDVAFREDNAIQVPGEYDGKPYSVDTVAIPAENMLEGGYVQRRLDSIERDKLVEDFLTIHLPKPIISPEQPISARYPLYSPVMNKIILDHQNGKLILKDDDPDFRISTQQLDKIMSRYDHLLPTDPAYVGVNDWFVVVEPHWGFDNKEVPALLYTLLERINHRYFKARVILNHYLTIGTENDY